MYWLVSFVFALAVDSDTCVSQILISRSTYKFKVIFGALQSRIQRGGGGLDLPLKKPHKNIVLYFFSNTGPGSPEKITKVPCQHSVLDHHRLASKVVFGSSVPSSTKKKRCQIWTCVLEKDTLTSV